MITIHTHAGKYITLPSIIGGVDKKKMSKFAVRWHLYTRSARGSVRSVRGGHRLLFMAQGSL